MLNFDFLEMGLGIVSLPHFVYDFYDCDVIDFEINLIFLIKPFSYMTKKSRQKFKYFENEKSFWGEKKALVIFFKGLSDAKNYLRP